MFSMLLDSSFVLKKEFVMKVAITIVNETMMDDYTFAGVVTLPKGLSLDDVRSLYCEYLKEEVEEDFTDWLVATKEFTEEKGVGYVYIIPEDYLDVLDEIDA
jgi:hypothetical protein